MITSWQLSICSLLCALVASTWAPRAAALGFEAFGPAGEHIGRSPDWAHGIEEVLRHASRVYWYDVNGGQKAYYDGDISAVNALLELYSRADLPEHPVALVAGRPSARSFHGKLTPYVVEFDVPGGLSLAFSRREASSGLVRTTPQLVIHFDAALVDRLDELKIPEGVSPREYEVRVEDALNHASDPKSGLRHRAIAMLGQAGDSSSASVKALKLAAEDENEAIRAAAEAAQAAVAAAQDPEQQAWRQRLSAFIRNHPQYDRTPTPEELLEALRKSDAEFATGFTARGTLVESPSAGPGRLLAWTLTMGDERLVIEQKQFEDADHPPTKGVAEYTIYAGPEKMGTIHGYRVWSDGKLIDVKPHASFEPVGSTYDLLIGRLLWPLGRGFTRRIDGISEVTKRADGLLEVTATNEDGSLMSRWELVIDPQADYLVRSAKAFQRDEALPAYVVETAGVLVGGGGRSVPHTARWIEDGGAPVSIAVSSVSATPDKELIERTEERLKTLRDVGQ